MLADGQPNTADGPLIYIKFFKVLFFNFLFNPRTYKGWGEGVVLSFFLEDKTSAPDVFSSCSFILLAHFEKSSVMVSFFGYEM